MPLSVNNTCLYHFLAIGEDIFSFVMDADRIVH